MFIFLAIRRLYQTWTRWGRASAVRSTRRGAPRLRVEALEDRTLLSAGALDPGFGAGGVVVNSTIPAWTLQPMSLAVQPDGKLVEAGAVPGTGGFEVVRQNVDGSADAAFGQEGSAFFSHLGAFSPAALATQLDGKILLAGAFVYGQDEEGPSLHPSPPGTVEPAFVTLVDLAHVGVIRLNSDGSLDPTFGNDGEVVTPFGVNDVAAAVLVQPDAKIVVAGSSDHQIALARYDANGQLDLTFGAGGEVHTAVGSTAQANAVALAPDGKIVVAGDFSTGNSPAALFVARYDSDGGLDSTFGPGGIVQPSLGDGASAATAVAVAPDGSVAVAGYDAASDGDAHFPVFVDTVLRLTPNGQADATFGDKGVVLTDIHPFNDNAGLALQGDGKLLLTSDMLNPGSSGSQVVLEGFTGDGSVDPTFGDDGRVVTTFGQASAFAPQAVIAPDGKVDVAAWTYAVAGNPDESGLTLARYESGYTPSAEAVTASSPRTAASSHPAASAPITTPVAEESSPQGPLLTEDGVPAVSLVAPGTGSTVPTWWLAPAGPSPFAAAVTGGMGGWNSDALRFRLLAGAGSDAAGVNVAAEGSAVMTPIDPIEKRNGEPTSPVDHSGEVIDAPPLMPDAVFLLPPQTGDHPAMEEGFAYDSTALLTAWSAEAVGSAPLVADGPTGDEHPWFAAAVGLLTAGASLGQNVSRRKDRRLTLFALPIEVS